MCLNKPAMDHLSRDVQEYIISLETNLEEQNAVPPIMAKAIAEKIIEYLGENKKQSNCQRILLEIMLDNSLTEMEIAKRLNISQATVSHTLIKLKTEGKVFNTQEGSKRKA